MAGSYLRQSTASQSRSTPPFLDDTDFKTAETALTIANTDVKLIVNGGASADKNSGGGTHRANGAYGLTFDATDTATVGEMEVSIKVAGALPVFMKFWVLEEAVYDAIFAASAAGYQVPIWASAGSTVNLSATTIKTATDVETDTADIQGRLPAALVGGRIDSNMGAISSDATAADNAEAFFDGTGYAGTGNVIPTVTTLTNLPAITTNWLTATGIAADAITAAKLAADVTTEIQSGLATAAELAKVPKSDSTVTWNATALASIQTEAEDAIVAHRLDELLNADSDIDGAAPPTVGSVFHELMSKTAGSFTFDQTTDSCEALRDRGDAAWTTATGFSTHTAADVWAAGTRTLTAGTNIQLPSNGLANVTAWTVAITGNITGNLSGSVGSVTGAVGSIATGGIVAASFGAGAIDAAAIAADAIGTSEFSTAAANKIADIVLRRTMTSVEASSFGETLDLSSLYGSVQMQQEASVSGSTLSVKRVDGSTALGTKTLGTTAGVDPVTSVS